MDEPDSTDPLSALPRGTRLAEFELLRVLGIGGFGNGYLDLDHAPERVVAARPAPRPAPPTQCGPVHAAPVLLQTRSLRPGKRCEGRVLVALSARIGRIARICAAEPGLRAHADCVPQRREAEQRPEGSR